MTNNILWYQTESMNKDILIHNGKILSIGAEYQELFNRLNCISEKAVRNKSPWCGMVDSMFFAKGHLDARDIQGRLLPFMFISDETDGKAALLRELQTIGKRPSEDTKICFEKKKRLSYVWIIALAITILAIIAIVQIYNN